MSIQDFRDKLDAEAALRLARSHGTSDSLIAFRDRIDAEHLVRQYNQSIAATNEGSIEIENNHSDDYR